MGEEKKNTEPVVLPEQKTQDEIYEEEDGGAGSQRSKAESILYPAGRADLRSG